MLRMRAGIEQLELEVGLKDQELELAELVIEDFKSCLLYTSPSPRDQRGSRMPSSA